MAKRLNDIYLKEDGGENFDNTPHIPGTESKKKKKPSSGWKKFRPWAIFLISIAIVIGLVYGTYDYIKGYYFDPVDVNNSAPVEITIEKGSSLNTISEVLYENGLIQNKQVFKLYVDFSDMSSKLKAGTYELSKNMDFDDIIYALQKGQGTAATARVKFMEGVSATNYANTLVESGILKNTTDYMNIVTTGEGFEEYDFVRAAIDKNNASVGKRIYLLEGYVFPDTYEFYTNASAKDVIKKQLDRFEEIFTDEYRARAEELGMSVDEVVTLASIIEKEAKTADFKKVSAVFHNRLDSEDMRLDSDATIAYAAGVQKLDVSEYLDMDSPYNTRLYRGLPPGPICNPGKAAIEAALYPDEDYNDYYYFTLKDPETGELVFSKTLEEHNAQVEKYQHLYTQADEKAAEAAANE
ncbi:MAG: endolytic transglycosylase MltG [Christensenella sp.]|nr:endolytic transglycosylase MltG [Christensenella sp.]